MTINQRQVRVNSSFRMIPNTAYSLSHFYYVLYLQCSPMQLYCTWYGLMVFNVRYSYKYILFTDVNILLQ